jgi:RNA polymerase sigma-70 factor (ECF subfamily)
MDPAQSQEIPVDYILFFQRAGNFERNLRVTIQVQLDRNAKSARFVVLVQPHLAQAYTLARWLTRSRDDADEVMQEACIRALNAIEQQSGVNTRAWLLAIVRNTAYTWLKAKKRIKLVGLDDLSERDLARVEERGAQDDPTVDPETEIISRANAQQLERMIAALPIEFKEALILRDIQGLGYHEIAEVTASPLGTVMSRLSRARKRLIHLLKEDDA